MRKIIFLAVLLFTGQALHAKKDTILLFHPTESNIATIEYLLKNNIFQLSNFHFKGVYHTTETYNYSKSREYLKSNPLLPFSLHEIQNELPGNMIYEVNLCSPEFIYLFSNSKGVIFLGGPDLPPSTYGEPTLLLTKVTDPGRHYFELSYLFHILGGDQNGNLEPLMTGKPDYGVLGICLGMQTINVATGGTMIQDIPQEIYNFSFAEQILESDPAMVHTNYYPREPDNNDDDDSQYTSYHFHKIELKPGFPELSENKEESENYPFVLSSHHQAIQDIGKDLIPVAYSMDGKIIEAIKHRRYRNVFGVQFHPEKTGLYDPDQQFMVTSDSSINFNHFLIENDWYGFHLSLWKSASLLFKQ